jgi:hypothetical protein
MKKITTERPFPEPPADPTLAWLLNGQTRFNSHQAAPQVVIQPQRREERDRAGSWLRYAGLSLGLLALAAAIVSYQAQFALVFAYKAQRVVAAIQAAIPDSGSLVFACLGIALALQGRRALRARTLNVACVGISIAMNALRATPGWSALSVWIMAPTLYALASDTLIGVIRAYAIARQKRLNVALADEGVTPLQVVGTIALYAMRACVALPSTASGLRRWLLLKTPLPERPPVKVIAVRPPKAITSGKAPRGPRAESKTSRFLALVIQKHGPLASFPLDAVSRTCDELAPEVELDKGSARTALRKAVKAAQNGGDHLCSGPSSSSLSFWPWRCGSPGGRSYPSGGSRGTASAIRPSGHIYVFTPAGGTPRCSSCGCTGAGGRFSASRSGPGRISPTGRGSVIPASTRSSSGAGITATLCAFWQSCTA